MFLFLRKSHMHIIIELLRHLYIHNLPSSLSYCTLPLVCTTAAVYYTYHKQFCESLTYQSYSQWLGNTNKGANLDEIETKFFQLTTPFLTTLLSTITMNLIPWEWRITRVCVWSVAPQVSLWPPICWKHVCTPKKSLALGRQRFLCEIKQKGQQWIGRVLPPNDGVFHSVGPSVVSQ